MTSVQILMFALLATMCLLLVLGSRALVNARGETERMRNRLIEERQRTATAQAQAQPAKVDALLLVPTNSRLAAVGAELSTHAGQVDVELPGSKARVVSVELVGGLLVLGLSALPVQYAQGAVDHPPASEWMGG